MNNRAVAQNLRRLNERWSKTGLTVVELCEYLDSRKVEWDFSEDYGYAYDAVELYVFTYNKPWWYRLTLYIDEVEITDEMIDSDMDLDELVEKQDIQELFIEKITTYPDHNGILHICEYNE